MAKKIKLTAGLSGRLIGAAAGGATSAVYDKYINPLLPQSVSAYAPYVKIALGAIAPAIIKNQLVTSIGDSLMAVGVASVTSDLLDSSSNTVAGCKVGTPTYPVFRNFVPHKERTPKTAKVNHVG